MFIPFSSCLAIILFLLLTYSRSLSSFNVGNERPRHFVEWVEKASFAHLNNLFEINAAKQAHNVLISDKNLQALIKNPKPFIIPVFPRLAPPLVPNKYFMLNDLPF